MIARETRRLRKVFERILVVSAAGSAGLAAHACSSGSGSSAGGGNDASASGDATTDSSSGPRDGQAEAAFDARLNIDARSGESGTGDSGSLDAGCSQTVPPEASWSQCCEPDPPYVFDAGADVSPGCAYHVRLPCGLPSFVQNVFPPNCALYLSNCTQICTGAAYPFLKCEVANGYGCDDDAMAFVAADGEAIEIECDKCNGVGRRPSGLAQARLPASGSALGRYLASATHLEAASVHAFERLAAELDTYGAPGGLVHAARRSARDEVRHARVMARIARRFGGEPPRVRIAPARARNLEALALENAVEGCVRETFGALVASWQARNAQDAELRHEMTRIAFDETRHAALAWAIARAIETRLDDRAKRRVARARGRAVATLREEVAARMPGEVACAAGLPGPEKSRQMLDELGADLWS